MFPGPKINLFQGPGIGDRVVMNKLSGTRLAMNRILSLSLMAIALTLGPGQLNAAERVDLELVMVADVSRSIDEGEARLQRQGVVAAFLSADVSLAPFAVAPLERSLSPISIIPAAPSIRW